MPIRLMPPTPEPPVIHLAGIVLPDATGGEPVDLGRGPRLALLTVIRHRY